VAAEEVESCIIMNEEPVDVKREDIITKSKKKKKIEKKRERERERERERRYPRSKMLSILCCCQ
jgi:hypothetical protein